MLFGRRKPGYTTTVDGSADPEQAVLELQKAELAAKKKPKAEVFDIDAASETARRLKETGSTFDGSAAKTGEDVIAAVERETAELAAKQAAEAAPEAAEAAQPNAAKPELLDFLASEPEAENDPFADQPTKTAPELPELTPAQELAGYIRARSAAALITPHALLLEEVENADELLAQMPTDPQCTDIVTRAGAKDTYYYSNANMSDNYAMIAQLIEDKDLCVMFAEMVRFNHQNSFVSLDERIRLSYVGKQDGTLLKNALERTIKDTAKRILQTDYAVRGYEPPKQEKKKSRSITM